jgi:hypothetical protein
MFLPSPQVAPGSSSDSQLIQNQSSDGKAKDPAVTIPVQSNVQDQMFLVQNQHQKYPTMRNQDGRLAGWGLPRDHFENDISNFLEPQLEEIPEVKYLQSYQATFEGTPETVHMNGEGVVFVYFNHGSKAFERVKISPTHAHMVIPIEKRAPVPPQKPTPVQPQRLAQQPILGMPVQTAPLEQPTLGMPMQTDLLQQSTSMQPVLTPTNTVAHTRSSSQQPINQGVTGQPIS